MADIFMEYSKDDIDQKFSTLATPENISNINTQLASIAQYNALNVRAPFGTNLTVPKGDGVTDDTSALQAFLNYQSGITIFIPDGTYLVSSPLTINNDSNLLLSNGATIKANASMDFLVKYNDQVGSRTSSGDTWSQHKFIKGGQLDANYLATNVLGLDYYMGFTLEDIKILNCSGYGLQTRLNSPSYAHELKATNLYFRSTQFLTGNTAIYNNAKDSIFSNIIIRDFHTGIWTGDGLFSKVHGWIGNASILADSRFIISDGTYTLVDQCYADTWQYSFVSRDGCLAVSNSTVINSSTLYNSSLQSSNPVVIFNSEASVLYSGQTGYFLTSGNTIHSYFNIKAVTAYDYRNSFGNDAFQGHNSSTIDLTGYQYFNSPTYQSIFTNTASYVTRAGRIVDLSIYGSITSAAANTWVTVANLPSEYIPHANRAIMLNGTDLQVLIKTDGTIQALSSTAITVSTPLRFTDTYIVNSISH